MPRIFVNSMANFMIQGGVVSFTLQDQATRTQGGQPVQAPPEDVVDLVMREGDFAQWVQFLNQHLEAYQRQTGKQLNPAPAGPRPQSAPAQASARPAGGQGGGLKIRPKGS